MATIGKDKNTLIWVRTEIEKEIIEQRKTDDPDSDSKELALRRILQKIEWELRAG